jgi:hypothetical protein
MAEGPSLSGVWRGLYSYPINAPDGGFTAELLHSAGRLSGVIRDEGGVSGPVVRRALVAGICD